MLSSLCAARDCGAEGDRGETSRGKTSRGKTSRGKTSCGKTSCGKTSRREGDDRLDGGPGRDLILGGAGIALDRFEAITRDATNAIGDETGFNDSLLFSSLVSPINDATGRIDPLTGLTFNIGDTGDWFLFPARDAPWRTRLSTPTKPESATRRCLDSVIKYKGVARSSSCSSLLFLALPCECLTSSTWARTAIAARHISPIVPGNHDDD